MLSPSSHGQIGRFGIKSELGNGALGNLYAADDPQLDRTVTLERIDHPADREPGQRLQFMQSLKSCETTARRLIHPGIVQIYEVDDFRGAPFIISEFMQGQALSEILAVNGPLPLVQSLRIAMDLLEALAFAHEREIAHGDLKPVNIILQPDGHARILGFGLSQAFGDPASRLFAIPAGTPRYMAPEQLRGGVAGPAGDLYSLGVVLFEMVTGQRPFPQDDSAGLLVAMTQSRPEPVKTLRADLPEAFCDLIDKALRLDPAHRPVSARAMAEVVKFVAAAETPPDTPLAAERRREIFKFIRKRIERKGDFPACSRYMAQVMATANSQHSSAASVSEKILKDFTLTNRILRMVNSPFYRGVGPTITTISRAVVILGMDTVSSVATGLGIFDHFSRHSSDTPELREKSVRALLTALQSRQLAKHVSYPNPEEAFVGGMMHNLGALTVAYYFPQQYAEIVHLIDQGELEEEAASRKVMRVSFAELGQELALTWNMPASIVEAMAGIPADAQEPRNPAEMLKCIIAVGDRLSAATMLTHSRRQQTELTRIATDFGSWMRASAQQLKSLIDDSIRGAWEISQDLRVELKKLRLADSLVTGESEQPASRSAGATSGGASASGSTAHASRRALEQRQSVIMKTVSEISNALMRPFQVNDILMMVLEAMHRGLGFDHVILAMVNPKRDSLGYRFGLGDRTEEIRDKFAFNLDRTGGLPAACILSTREVHLPNLQMNAGNLAFSPTLLSLLKPRSVAMLPLIVSGKAIGLFYADRRGDQNPISTVDLADMRTLANQAVLAIQT